MDKITPETLWAWLLAGASALVLLANAAEKIIKAVKAARKPNEDQNARIGALEERMDGVDGKLDRDKHRLDAIEEGNRVSQRALLALLDHALDGNNIEQMKNAKDGLQQHLINR